MLKEMKKKFIKRFTRMHTYLDGNALVMDGSPDAVWEFFEPHIYSYEEVQKEREEAYKSGYIQGAIEYSKDDEVEVSQTKGGKE